MTPLIDTHCHLFEERFANDLEEVLHRAAEADVRQIVAVGAFGPIDSDRRTVVIAERHDNIFAAVGVHPHDASDCDDARIGQLRDLARSSKVVAIGESGLDFHYMNSPREAQERSLRRHLELAAELDRPIVIHCRDAEARLAAIVREAGLHPAGGVIHCFTGDSAAAGEFLALGFHISLSGILTFRSATTLREAARMIPDDRVMVETDAPFLTPEPHRGHRNEPAYVAFTLQALARVRNADPARLGEQIAINARRLFRLPGFSS